MESIQRLLRLESPAGLALIGAALVTGSCGPERRKAPLRPSESP